MNVRNCILNQEITRQINNILLSAVIISHTIAGESHYIVLATNTEGIDAAISRPLLIRRITLAKDGHQA